MGEEQASDFTGTIEDVEQEQPTALPLPPVRVDVSGPVPVQTVGSRAGDCRSRNLADTDLAIRIMNRDPRRRTATIVSATQTIYVGTDQASVAAGVAFLLPIGQLFPITHGEEIWVSNPNTATSTVVSWAAENWAD